MATQGERRALFFLAAVALLGAGTRAWRGRRVAVDTTGLTRQIEAIEAVGGKRESGIGNRSRRPVDSRFPSPDSRARQSVDLDTAPAPDIEKLPGIGPALASRIVKDRDTNGPFGCLAALDRVKGVGPSLLARIDSLATFSAVGRVPCASGVRPPVELPRR